MTLSTLTALRAAYVIREAIEANDGDLFDETGCPVFPAEPTDEDWAVIEEKHGRKLAHGDELIVIESWDRVVWGALGA